MYQIIGIDGKQYGPIAAGQLLDWIAQGRADGMTKALAEGTTEWKPLSQFPEFAAALKARVQAPPTGSVPAAPADSATFAQPVLSGDYSLDIGSCVSRSWNVLKANFWLLVGATFVAVLVGDAVPFLFGVSFGGVYYLWLRLIRGQPAQFGDVFAGFSQAFLQLFLAAIVVSLLSALGFILCVLPGIYLAVAWLFTFALVMDKKMDFWPAMELSRKVVGRHWWLVFGLCIVCALLQLLGSLCCLVGVLVTMPLVFGAFAFAYEDIFGSRTLPAAQH
jgi:hypothetical protein